MYSISEYLKLSDNEILTFLLLGAYITFVCVMSNLKRKGSKHGMFYFAYCEGSTRNVVAREPVTANEFYYYDEYVGLPVLHMTKECIYFKLQDC